MHFAVLLIGTLFLCAAAPRVAAQPATVGWIERARLGPEGVVVAAKLDTGADFSSLHATDVRWHLRDDGDWVEFEVLGENGQRVRFERKVVRIARVRRASGGAERRPTILLGVCVGRVYRVTEVNLTDRSRFEYEFLVGRSFLAGHFVVDSARMNTVEPACERSGAQ
jgi:hypothetical protein